MGTTAGTVMSVTTGTTAGTVVSVTTGTAKAATTTILTAVSTGAFKVATVVGIGSVRERRHRAAPRSARRARR